MEVCMRQLSGLIAALAALGLGAPAFAQDEKPPGIVTYDKGTTFTSGDGDFQLKIVGRLQARWEMFRVDDGDDATETEITHRFQIARGRVTLEGFAFGDIEYK